MIPFCDTPEQSLVVGVAAGLVGGVVGVLAGLDVFWVVVLAGGLALVGEVAAHVVRGDEQWREAVGVLR